MNSSMTIVKAAFATAIFGLFWANVASAADRAQTEPTKTPAYIQLHEDVLINADLWTDQPEILAASWGFEGIIGIPGLLNAGDLDKAIDAGAGVNLDWAGLDPTPPIRNLTSGASQVGILAVGFGNIIPYADAMPIEFSWPLLPSTVSPDNIQITLNTGEVVTPVAAALNPNYDYNERHVIVVFGIFGNRILPGDPGAVYPVLVTFVAGDSPLKAVGPNGPVSIIGLSRESSNPFVSGPQLVGAKLTRYSSAGDFPPPALDTAFPNDAWSLYGSDAQYRLRLYTSGGFSPDGVSGYMPQDFASTFRLTAENSQGQEVLIDKANTWYDLGVGKLMIVGMAEVGPPDADGAITRPYYQEDHDNYFDIIIKGDEAAVRQLKAVEIPTSAVPGYTDIYNPGGPGRTPQPDITYTAPAAPQLFPIDMSLDKPKTVSYAAQSLGAYRTDSDVPVVFRLQTANGGEIFTANTGKAAQLVSGGATLMKVVFANERERADVKAVHLLVSPDGSDHVYTLDTNEQTRLIADGWADQGRIFGAFDHDEPGLAPVYQFFDNDSNRHYYGQESDANAGMENQGIAWYSVLFAPESSSDDGGNSNSGGGGGMGLLIPGLMLVLALLRRRKPRPAYCQAER